MKTYIFFIFIFVRLEILNFSFMGFWDNVKFQDGVNAFNAVGNVFKEIFLISENGKTERAKIEHGYYGGELPAGYMLGNPNNNNNSGGFGNIATIGMAFCGFLFLVVLLVLFKQKEIFYFSYNYKVVVLQNDKKKILFSSFKYLLIVLFIILLCIFFAYVNSDNSFNNNTIEILIQIFI